MKAAFFARDVPWVDGEIIAKVFAGQRRTFLESLTDMHPVTVSRDNLAAEIPKLAELEIIFGTWGMPALTVEQVARLPRLKGVFYAAGSVAGFARPFLERGIPVISAKQANAKSVAEFCLAQILLGMKGYFRNTREYRSPEYYSRPYRGPGNNGDTVAIVGAGEIGRRTLELLRPFPMEKVVVESNLSADEVAALGARKVTLAEAFATAHVVSNHLADSPATRGVFTAALFRTMRPGAVFINTGRGPQVIEADLSGVLAVRPDLTVLLDVTDPEPPDPESPLFKLANVNLTTHMAGSFNNEIPRMADLIIEEFLAFREGRPLRCSVSMHELETRA